MRSPPRLMMGMLVAAMALAAPALASAPPAVPTRPVEMQRYFGRWYEIARIPNQYERGADCSAPTADYAETRAGGVAVTQVCHRGSPTGSERTYRATARILDPGTNARLRLTYYYVITKDYWVLDHAGDYGWAILGDPSGKYLWLLSRAPYVATTTRTELMQRVRALGYDTARLEFPQQR